MDILEKFYEIESYNEGPSGIILDYIGAPELLITIDYIWNDKLSVIYVYPWTVIPEEVKKGIVVCIRSPNISYVYEFLQIANLSINFEFLLYGTEVNKWVYYLFFEILYSKFQKKFECITLRCSSRCVGAKYTKVDIKKFPSSETIIEYNIEDAINKIQYHIRGDSIGVRLYHTHEIPNRGDFSRIYVMGACRCVMSEVDVYAMHILSRAGVVVNRGVRFLSGADEKMYLKIRAVHNDHMNNMRALKLNWYIDHMYTI